MRETETETEIDRVKTVKEREIDRERTERQINLVGY